MRFVVLGWLAFFVFVWLRQLIVDFVHRGGWRAFGNDFLVLLIGFSMAYGYLWMAVRVGRSGDRLLIRVLRSTLASEGTAAVVAEFFSSAAVSFVDGRMSLREPSPRT